MTHTLNFVFVLGFLCNLGVVFAAPESGAVSSCYRIDPLTISCIITADVVLTIIIVVLTYHCASVRRAKVDNAHKVYMNVRANRKS